MSSHGSGKWIGMTLASVSLAVPGASVAQGIVPLAAVLLVIGVAGATVYIGLRSRTLRRQTPDNSGVSSSPASLSIPAPPASRPQVEEPVVFTRRSALKLLGAGGVALAAPILSMSAEIDRIIEHLTTANEE